MLARWQVELRRVIGCWHELLRLLKVHGAAILGSLLASHVLLGLYGCCAGIGASSFHMLHVDLGACSHMIALNLRLLLVWLLLNLDLGGNLSCRCIELVIHNLVVVDQGRSVRATALRIVVIAAVDA